MNLRDYMHKEGITQDQLAKAMGVIQAAVSQWLATKVPLERCVDIEKFTNGAVRCEEIRPDKADYFAYLRECACKE